MATPPEMKFTLRTKGRLKTVEEFENIIVKSNRDGSNVRLKDVARVELGAEMYSSSATISSFVFGLTTGAEVNLPTILFSKLSISVPF